MSDIRSHWPEILADQEPLRERLVAAYSEPHRRYHDLRHLEEVLERISLLVDAAGDTFLQHIDLDAVLLAAWFHDAVYDGDRDDEDRSASLAERELAAADVDDDLVSEVARLIRLTATHEVVDDDLAGQVLCDADLGILAAEQERYEQYAAAVRQEYQHIGDDDFRTGRTAVLARLLEAPALFTTAYAKRHWEQAARANLELEMSQLER
ncbi:MAG TPA: hypothetical protein VFG63_00200 [Nocardioidaceae bacterium]|nr:hypothetical protein [Nocardioidaceae bacterium]